MILSFSQDFGVTDTCVWRKGAVHKSFIPLPSTQHHTLPPVKAVPAPSALETSTHIPT